MQPDMICTHAWNGRSRRAARPPLRRGPSSKKPAGAVRPPAPHGRLSSSGRRCRFCGPSAPSTNGKRAKKSSLLGLRQAAGDEHDARGSSRLSRAAVPRCPARRSSALFRTVQVL